MRVNDDGRTVAGMDVLVPGIGEIIGGSQREERLAVLDRGMAERGIDQEHCASYRETEIKRRRPAAWRVRPPLPPPDCSSPPPNHSPPARSTQISASYPLPPRRLA